MEGRAMTWHEEQQGEDRKRRSRTGSSLAQFFKGQQSNSNKDDGVESVAAERPTKVVWVTVNDKTDQHVMRASLDIADEGLYNSIISILAGRDYLKLDKFKRRNRILNHRALEALQALAFLVEYCRASASKSGTIDLFVIDDASEARRPCVEFALKRINACPKACCRIKAASGDTLSYCPRIGTISCAKCGIALWCSEECLDLGFAQHEEACRAATNLRDQLGLN